jgi:predicted metal-dependent hydrolase
MDSITFGQTKIQYEIKRGKRTKTVALLIQPNTSIIVLTPRLLSEEKIRQIVTKRAGWIIRQTEKIKKLRAAFPAKEFVSGESFPYLGRQYRLKVTRTNSLTNSHCKLAEGRFHVKIHNALKNREASEFVRQKLVEWYMEKAEKKIKERIAKYTALVGKQPKKVIVKDQGKRWGSCSHANTLRFNWKIVMAPISVLDYVIVHELCHMVINNHSDKFWGRLRSIIPDYPKKRVWLKENSILLAEMMD